MALVSTAGNFAPHRWARVGGFAEATLAEDPRSNGIGTPERAAFCYEAGSWMVAYGGSLCRLKDTKGLRYIVMLLSRPGQRVAAIELVRTLAGGGDVHAPSDRASRERARLNVIRAVDAALRRIKQHHPALREHLEHTLRRGLYCGYTPDPRLPIQWEVGTMNVESRGAATTAGEDGQQQARRLLAIGAQAACVAHELKAPLSLIDGSLQALEEYVTAAAEYILVTRSATSDAAQMHALDAELELPYLTAQAPSLLGICRDGARRLRRLVEQLVDYTRGAGATAPTTAVALAPLLRNAIALASAGRPAVPPVHAELADVPPVYGDGHALSQVFINLIGNAFDAVAATANPQVGVILGPCATPLRGHAAVAVRIRDNGPGIPPHLRQRIFEPFFSTKSRQSGLGLGLAIARDIVETHGGTLAVAPASNGTANHATAARRACTCWPNTRRSPWPSSTSACPR